MEEVHKGKNRMTTITREKREFVDMHIGSISTF